MTQPPRIAPTLSRTSKMPNPKCLCLMRASPAWDAAASQPMAWDAWGQCPRSGLAEMNVVSFPRIRRGSTVKEGWTAARRYREEHAPRRLSVPLYASHLLCKRPSSPSSVPSPHTLSLPLPPVFSVSRTRNLAATHKLSKSQTQVLIEDRQQAAGKLSRTGRAVVV